MKEIKTDIIINAPIQKVWDSLTNFESYPSWNPFIISIKGKLLIGEILETIIMNGGKENKFKPSIVKLNEGESFEWRGSLPLGLFNGNHYFILEKIDEQTTQLIHGERFTGLLHGIIMKMIGAETLRGFQAMNEALKRKVENQDI